jgi:hypothetical protein
MRRPTGTHARGARAFLALCAATAVAQEQPDRFQVALDRCPDAAAFVENVAMRKASSLSVGSAVEPSDPALRDRLIAMERRDQAVRGQLTVRAMDRVLLAQGKPQRYGTQVVFEDGEPRPRPVENLGNIDSIREQIDLMPLNDYLCVLKHAYGPASPRN